VSGALHIAILAAGKARRFGGAKLDLPIAGKALGRWALDSALALNASRLVIIVPEDSPAFARNAAERGLATLVVNAEPDNGLSSSVAVAAADADAAGSDALLLMLADMPAVTSETLRQLVEKGRAEAPAAVRHENGNAGIPACFPRDYFAALKSLKGDRGAAALLRRAPNLQLLAVRPAELRDVDVLEDVAAARRTLFAQLRGG